MNNSGNLPASEAEIAAWALNSYPEDGDGAFMVQSPLLGGVAGAVWEGLRGYFVSRPFVRAIQRAVADRNNEVAVSIESQETGCALYSDHAADYLTAMFALHGNGALPFGAAPDVYSATQAWVEELQEKR